MNISVQNILGKCDLKCSYNFKYSESNITAKNNSNFISLTCDNSSVPPVTYNNQKYNVSKVLILCPSIHLFNNSTLQGEIIIEHTPVQGGKLLDVAIPIKLSNETTTASNLITDIIQGVANNAPSDGDATNMNISGFTLEAIVPKKPFYSYTSNNTDWIVFGDLEAIPLNSNTLKTLSKVIKPSYIPTQAENGLFYNSSGPNSNTNLGDGIYISCQPTGSSEEETAVTYEKTGTNKVSFDLLSNPYAIILILILAACIIFSVLFYILNFVYNYLTSDSPKLPSFSL